MISIGQLKLSTATAIGGTPALRLVTPVAADERHDGVADLDRHEVEELRDKCDAWLRGEVLR